MPKEARPSSDSQAAELLWECGSCGWGFPAGAWRSKCPACTAVGWWRLATRLDVQPWPGYQCATAPGVPADPIPLVEAPRSLVDAALESLVALGGMLVASAAASLQRALEGTAAEDERPPTLVERLRSMRPVDFPPTETLVKWQQQLRGEGYAVPLSGLWDDATLAATEAYNRRQPPRCDCGALLARYAGPGGDRGWCCVRCDDPFEGTSPGGES
jgi:hypothetical protein